VLENTTECNTNYGLSPFCSTGHLEHTGL